MVIRLLHNEKKWLTAVGPDFGTPTPYSRMNQVYLAVNKSSYYATGSMLFISLNDGYQWSFGRDEKLKQVLNLRKWSDASRDTIISFTEKISDLAHNFTDVMATFFEHDIVDEKGFTSPQQTNKWMATMIDSTMLKIKAALANSTGQQLDVRKFVDWMDKEQSALKDLAIIFCLACGISFRSWQLASICYNSSEKEKRNTYVLKDGTVICSHPLAKQRNKDRESTFLAFPIALSRHISFHLFIMKPAVCKLLSEIDSTGIQVGSYSTHIWVHSPFSESEEKPPGSQWNGRYVSDITMSFTKKAVGIEITPLLARQITHAVFRDTLPQLFLKPSISLSQLDLYGHGCGFPNWNDIKVEECVRILSISKIWQALIEIDSFTPEAFWMPLVEGSLYFGKERHENLEEAVICARRIFGSKLDGQRLTLDNLVCISHVKDGT